jgi:hypothetical protein
VLTRTSALKIGIMGMWEPPTPATTRQAADARTALQRAVAEANAFLTKAATVSQSLKAYDITLTVPSNIK